MDESQSRRHPPRWRQFTIGLLMLVVAASALIFALVLPEKHDAVVRRAMAIASANQPGFVASQFRVKTVFQSADKRFWVVRMSPVNSAPRQLLTVVVPDGTLSQ
jgi:hypothetical protein